MGKKCAKHLVPIRFQKEVHLLPLWQKNGYEDQLDHLKSTFNPYFILHTYPELLKETAQNQTGNYLIALQNLTNKDIVQLKEQIKLSTNEVDCLNRILSL